VAVVLFDAIDCTVRWADEVTEQGMKWDGSRGKEEAIGHARI
jgi:hypothetical protein